MSYTIKGSILGFDTMINAEIHEVDDLFSTIQDADNKHVSFTVINPYLLREYSFDLPSSLKVLLEIHENSNVSVYNIVVIGQPLEESSINFLAPIIVNNDNKKIGQAVLTKERHPDFGMSEKIKSFRE